MLNPEQAVAAIKKYIAEVGDTALEVSGDVFCEAIIDERRVYKNEKELLEYFRDFCLD